ncbi:MAG: phosphoesterase [Desulfovibrio sp.]|nr:phosphoesterase [Desulfovibrio sp.]
MAFQAEHVHRMKQWRNSLNRDERWCVLISADPDAMASALALKRLMHGKVRQVDIMRINEVTRPDNLAMIRYLRIPVRTWQPEKLTQYQHFAMVDSQPCHNHAFDGLTFACIIDHHPQTDLGTSLTKDGLCDIRPSLGATSSMMARYLQALRIKPGPLLATALLYGIRTDTAAFARSGGEKDLRAYQWLSQQADTSLLQRIIRSEYLRAWLPIFSRAFRNLRDCRGGALVNLNEVDSADLLVAIADFFTKVHGLKWIAVSGVVSKTVIVIFRGDGGRDIGRLADACFYDVGTAGGHRSMGRAEFPLTSVPANVKAGDFVYQRLLSRKLRPISAAAVQE